MLIHEAKQNYRMFFFLVVNPPNLHASEHGNDPWPSQTDDFTNWTLFQLLLHIARRWKELVASVLGQCDCLGQCDTVTLHV